MRAAPQAYFELSVLFFSQLMKFPSAIFICLPRRDDQIFSETCCIVLFLSTSYNTIKRLHPRRLGIFWY